LGGAFDVYHWIGMFLSFSGLESVWIRRSSLGFFLLRHKFLGALVSLKFSGSMLMDSNKIQGLESSYHILKV
jgi:hypothetical protein